MAISVAALTAASGSDTDASSYATASVTPTADKLVLAFFNIRRGSATVATPTLTGCGITWTLAAHTPFNSIAAPNTRVCCFRGLHASPSAGALTLDMAGDTHTSAAWAILECTGVDTAQGSQGVIQAATNRANAGSDPTITLSAFGSATNATLATQTVIGVDTITVKSGFSNVGQRFQNGSSLCVEFLATQDTNPTFDNSANGAWGMIGLELAEVAAGGSAVPRNQAHYRRRRMI